MENHTPDQNKAPLSPEYYKARRQLMLFSGILLAWELIGLELKSNVAVDALNLNLTIKSPQAAPWVLISLIVYFSARTIIEWHQSPIDRRAGRASKYDARLSRMLPILSLAVFLIQTLFKVQIADFFSIDNFVFFISGFTIPSFTFIGYHLIQFKLNKAELTIGWLSIIFVISIIIGITIDLLQGWNVQQELIYEGKVYIIPKALFTLSFIMFGAINSIFYLIIIAYDIKRTLKYLAEKLSFKQEITQGGKS